MLERALEMYTCVNTALAGKEIAIPVSQIAAGCAVLMWPELR